LDTIRGLAALAVCTSHLRAFFLVDFAKSGGGLAAKLFYTVTGAGHQAVMIFFVLSGFLVGGSVVRSYQRGSWTWSGYLLRRLSRLWVVIVPALILTLFWDLLGAHFDPAGYAGRDHAQLLSGPANGYDISPLGFVGNVLFLQTVTVSPFGSNGPLWSLANEFWYYLLFPLGLQALLGPRLWTSRALATAAIVGICFLLPVAMLEYGVIWLFGVGAFLALDNPKISRVAASWPLGLGGGVSLAATLLASRAGLWEGNDFLIGLSLAAMIPWLARAKVSSDWYRRIGFILSEFSYTLYLVHFPLLAWIYFVFLAPRQLAFNATSLAILAGLLALVTLYAWAIWWLFERNTDRVRMFASGLFGRLRWWGLRA
jgi:peptidoglycan/LPS O-acetylase OafA/YrhL